MTNFLITAYCACTICCGPKATGLTASGKPPVQGRTVACNWLPLGTSIVIDGHKYVVEDRMAKRFSNRVDIYFRSHAEAKKFGIKKGTIK